MDHAELRQTKDTLACPPTTPYISPQHFSNSTLDTLRHSKTMSYTNTAAPSPSMCFGYVLATHSTSDEGPPLTSTSRTNLTVLSLSLVLLGPEHLHRPTIAQP